MTGKGRTVFIGGSRRIAQLPARVAERVENIIAGNLKVLVGDADGADRVVQQYLAAKAYSNVEVFHSGRFIRNNVGNWRARSIPVMGTQRDFNFYATKDLAMSREADYGLMIWDADSQGTLNNVVNLLEGGKHTLIYLTPSQSFVTVKSPQDMDRLLQLIGRTRIQSLDRKLALHQRLAILRSMSR